MGRGRSQPTCYVSPETHEALTGEKLPLKNNFEFCAASDLNAEHLARLVCGMLNSGLGGSIFIGVDPDGLINGEDMDYTYKDEIRRLCINCMTELIKPSIFNYDVKFCQIKKGQL
ncbi:hypothetical protein Btru_046209 [Bulinus truncatus]|nr:hypothetical protein Btru_046209 [Bulinus truncatus]